MSFWDFLYRLLIYPLELIFEVIYTISEKYIQNPGLSIIVLSLVMNILVLPLYMKADRLQEEAREKESRLAPAVRRIRETFKGDERFMMLSAYYRENDYSPLSSLKGSLSLLLEIPFFISAYHFLSNLGYIRGVSLGPLKDLGSPDGLIVIGSVTLNLLPVLMTLINIISSYIYAKDFPKKTKIQLYVIAGIFLVLLYNSPSGLVFYWILNNLFSLFKNVFYKIRHSGTVIGILSMCLGLFLSISSFRIRLSGTSYGGLLLAVGLAFILAGSFLTFRRYIVIKNKEKVFSPSDPSTDKKVFLLCSVFVALLSGAETTAEMIAVSFHDFVEIGHYTNPFWFVLSASATSIGLFVIWMSVFYNLSGPYGKRVMSIMMWIFSTTAILNKVITGLSGTKFFRPSVASNAPLTYYDDVKIYLIILLAVITLSYVLWGNAKKIVLFLSFVFAFTMIIMTSYYGIIAFRLGNNDYYLDRSRYAAPGVISLSRSGRNVVVIMMDREVPDFIPAVMEEYPDTASDFEGFVYYPNTLSYGNVTVVGAPGLLGGYEYIPGKMNERDDVSMKDKMNEANLLLPVLFEQNGFESVVCDPPYAGYELISDLSVFEEKGIDSYLTNGAFSGQYDEYEQNAKEITDRQMRNFFCYGVLRVSPVFLWDIVYDQGNYNCLDYPHSDATYAFDINEFIDSYNVLLNLEQMTRIGDEGDHYTYFGNLTMHEPVVLYGDEHNGSIALSDGTVLDLSDTNQIAHYQINATGLIQLGKWFRYLKENGVYDNTRIIIVSDHSTDLGYEETIAGYSIEPFHCTLMVKDFDSTGEFRTDMTNMTNADVPLLSTKGIIDDPHNPFTGRSLTGAKEEAGAPVLIYTEKWNPFDQNENTYAKGDWFKVTGEDQMDVSSWEHLGYY